MLTATTYGKGFNIGDDDEIDVSDQGVSISVTVASSSIKIEVQYRDVERKFTLMQIRNYDPSLSFQPEVALSGMTISHAGSASAKRILVSNANVGVYIVPQIDFTSVVIATTKRYQELSVLTASSGTNESCLEMSESWCNSLTGAKICGIVDTAGITADIWNNYIRSPSYFGPVYMEFTLYHSGTDVSIPSGALIVFTLVFLSVRFRSGRASFS